MTGQDLIAHQAQLGLGETTQIVGVHQIILQHPTHVALISNLLLCHTVLQIVGRQGECIAAVAIRLAHSQEVHALLTNIIHTPSYLATDGNPPMRIGRGKRVTAFHTIDLIQEERVASHVHTLAIHPDIAGLIDSRCVEALAIPPVGTILNRLCSSSE